MKIGFLVDGGYILGLGHLSRCLSIANYLSKKNIDCIFITSNNSLEQKIKSEYHFYKKISSKNKLEQLMEILKNDLIDILIIDSKSDFFKNKLHILKEYSKIVVIDNLVLGKEADLLILPGLKEQFNHFPNNSLCGENFILLNPKLNSLKYTQKNNSIFLSMGGSDKNNITELLVSSLVKTKFDFNLIIILGQFYKHEKKIRALIRNDSRFQVLVNPPNLYSLMSECKLGIVSFGVTVYESAKAKLPLLVISHSNENDVTAKKLEKYGWYKYLGKFDSIQYDEISKLIISTYTDHELLENMSKCGEIIDGLGYKRVGENILKLVDM